ncbi:MAG: dihydroorotate dehydrogenase electron transfer subunit [Thermoguttaceae bacterium]|nr:dihydroorotate dehydrogenase electron transfer subunit [Thermoguttaceae bacterium]
MSEHCECANSRPQGGITFLTGSVLECEQVAKETFRLRIGASPKTLAEDQNGWNILVQQMVPGQFVMVRQAGKLDPLLGRAFAIYQTSEPTATHLPTAAVQSTTVVSTGRLPWVEIVYLRVGKATTAFSSLKPGEAVEVWGPLGNGFPLLDPTHCDHLICVAGGIGQTPMRLAIEEALGHRPFLGRSIHTQNSTGDVSNAIVRPIPRVSFCYGARSGDYLADVSAFESEGAQVHIATEDGSQGTQGRVTDLIEQLVKQDSADSRQRTCLFVCGPQPMLVAVQRQMAELHLHGYLSLETPMACGLGICFSCVAKIKDAQGRWDYRRTCTEGPVFEAQSVLFE